MELKGILSISGQPGLFKLVKQAKNAIIVESLTTKKRMPAYATSKISALEDIAIFTETEDKPLIEVFKNIYEKEDGGKAINHKSPGEELKSYFAEILPEYDRARVYTSDMKRVINWYNILHNLDMVSFDDEEESDDSEKKAENEETEETGDTQKQDNEATNQSEKTE